MRRPPGLLDATLLAEQTTDAERRCTTAAPMDVALRITRARVRTAVWTLTHPTTGRTVTLVGVMHIGDVPYFQNLSALLAGLAASGAEVHVEGISRHDRGCLTEWEEDRLAEADGWEDAETSVAAVSLLRLASQSAQLGLPDGARNVDLTDADLLRRVGWDNYRRLFASQPATPPGPGFGRGVRAAVRFQLRHGRVIEALGLLRPRNRSVNRVVIGERNRVAFAGGVDALARGDVALLWGTDHLPGLARLFVAAGYRLRREDWFEACTI
jgi:hypothetical protein